MDEASRTDSLPNHAPLHDATIEAVLRAAIARKGPALLYAPPVLKSLLEEQCPRATADIALLLLALEAQVPEALLGVYSGEEMQSLTRRLEDRLCERQALDRRSAGWAVGTWARALRAGAVEVPMPANAMPEAPHGDLSTDPDDAPAWLRDPRPRTSPFTRWHAIAGVMAAIVIAAIALYVNSQRTPRAWIPGEELRSAPPTASPVVPPLAAPAASSAPVVAEATPPLPAPAPTIPAAPPVVESRAVATRPSTIVGIGVPARIVAGRRFSLTIDYRPGSGTPVSIERRSVPGSAGAAQTVVVKRIAQLAGPRAGTLRYPFDAIATPARNTFEFTLIDEDGARSAPRGVVVEVVAAASRSAAVACTRTTCGTVVSSREIATGPKAPSRLYETVIRLNDRTLRTVRQPNRWTAGAQVRVTAAGKLVALEKVATKPAKRPANEQVRGARP